MKNQVLNNYDVTTYVVALVGNGSRVHVGKETGIQLFRFDVQSQLRFEADVVVVGQV